MCIAILVPKGKCSSLTDQMLEDCYLVNSDGIGYAFPNKKKGITIKKFMVFKDFMNAWESDKLLNKNRPMMLHFRATSVGSTDEDNCHPFVITDEQAFCHNGTIKNVEVDTKGYASDTRMFNRLFLRELPEGWDKNVAITSMMEDYIGTSKLIILNADESYTIINEAKGEWSKGIWYSNGHYTGEYIRGNGMAYKPYNGNRSTTCSHATVGGSAAFVLAAANRKDKRDKKRKQRLENQRRLAYDQHPTEHIPLSQAESSSSSSEVMCEFCNTPYEETDLILIDFGNKGVPFSVCHTCVNKIHFDSKGLE